MPPDETSARRHQVPGEHRRTGQKPGERRRTGRMTPARRHQVVAAAREAVAVAGEAVADLVADQPAGAYVVVPGGSPTNIAVPRGRPTNIALPGGSPAARLGTQTRIVARVGTDPLGRALRDHLTANGVGTETVVTAPSSARMHHDADGLRTDREHQEAFRAVR